MITRIKPPELLSRDEFREGVFTRDNHKCVICGDPAKDAHHILERRLFGLSGGYYLDNGASVCKNHHLDCEMTLISVESVREACGITRNVVPDHLYDDHSYDKWGNCVLDNGKRTRGELFYDESVQKIITRGGVLDLFTHYVKYPRTLHLPWSEGIHKDDRVIDDTSGLVGCDVIVTEKLDGENTSLYSDHFHARSVDGRHHPSRDWAKNFWSGISHDIPDGWRICGENMYAEHSIHYGNLESYFYGFSIWTDRNECLSWDDTLEWFELLGIAPVPVLYQGVYSEAAIQALYDSKRDWSDREGYVVRTIDGFNYGGFRNHVAKFVRKGHVQTNKHWMMGQRIVQNELRAN